MNKKRMIIIFSIIFLMIIVLCLIVYYNKIDKYYMNAEILQNYEEFERKQFEKTVFMNNYSEFYAIYKGNIKTSDINRKIYDIFHKKIPELYLKKNELTQQDEINKYYTENEKSLNILGIKSSEELSEIMKSLNKYTDEKLELKKVEIVKSSCVSNSKGVEFNANITYNDQNNIMMKITIYNVTKYGSFIEINAVVEE